MNSTVPAERYRTDSPSLTAAACRAAARRRRADPARRLLDDFLIATLNRAVTLAERDHSAAAIAEDLHFDVARLIDVTLDEHAGIAEKLLAETLHALECLLQLACDRYNATGRCHRRRPCSSA